MVSLYRFALFFRPQRKSRAEFAMTITEPSVWTSAPTTGFRIQSIASTIAMKLSYMENVMLSLMVVIMRLERARR